MTRLRPSARKPINIFIMNLSTLIIAGTEFSSRLFLGTGKYSSGEVMAQSLAASGTQLVTVALRRMPTAGASDAILTYLDRDRYRLMPNTSGVRDAKEAVLAAELAREALQTDWIKLEIHPDARRDGATQPPAHRGALWPHHAVVCAAVPNQCLRQCVRVLRLQCH
jgi:hypothetical protein